MALKYIFKYTCKMPHTFSMDIPPRHSTTQIAQNYLMPFEQPSSTAAHPFIITPHLCHMRIYYNPSLSRPTGDTYIGAANHATMLVQMHKPDREISITHGGTSCIPKSSTG